jgi:hypothetical protein
MNAQTRAEVRRRWTETRANIGIIALIGRCIGRQGTEARADIGIIALIGRCIGR